jgi:hypothetical protein
MKRPLFTFAAGLAILTLAGCSFPSLGPPALLPTPLVLSSPTPLPATPTMAASAMPAVPTFTPTISLPSVTPGNPPTALPSVVVPTVPVGGATPGSPSGPYAVIQVNPAEVLNIHSAPGSDIPIIGSFPANATNVMRTGPSSTIGEGQWVQMQALGGGSGWVDAVYLTEYVAPAAFCADGRVNTLLSNFANALKTSDGGTLASLVSPSHGMTVRLWRNGNAITFLPQDTRWIFTSTYEHDWGAAPGSGLDTVGAIHVVVLPKWLDVLNASYTTACNVIQTGGASYNPAWPEIYANINFYSLYKPGPAGNELSWRTLLIGVEYVNGLPYIFSLTQLDWEP